ncbi:protein FAR-RED ELONGATED HYPOCOTYL 3-like, partial [Neltuma alba]|uniref:protein FAR-RED ELONGATED HYPOCOTYL 3-like n=1 Tax=Neltuma alba TaxID=207710 RepID=UPI0010A59573
MVSRKAKTKPIRRKFRCVSGGKKAFVFLVQFCVEFFVGGSKFLNATEDVMLQSSVTLNSDSEVMTVGGQDNMQQMDKFNARAVTLDGYYGSQQSVQGMLNLMGPTRDSYYGNQQTIQGLGQLSSIPTSHDGYYGAHQSMPGLVRYYGA